MRVRRATILWLGAATALLGWLLVSQIPAIAAGALLHPWRRVIGRLPPAPCVDATFEGAGGIAIRGWRCVPSTPPVGTVVFLHGVADNRMSGAGVVKRFVSRGFEAVTYDSRAHGESGGDFCTYGYYEKDDLRRVLTAIDARRVVVIGHSLGGAVALQAAAEDDRIATVIAVESFSDLRTVAGERAFYLPAWLVAKAFRYAEEKGTFHASLVSPEKAAARIKVPVLVIHGTADDATSPEHSVRIHAALAGPKRLVLVEGAGHTQSLARADIWDTIEKWIDEAVGAARER